MFSYFAYGLGVHSTLPLPEFLPAEVECDVLIRLSPTNNIPEEAIGKPFYLRVSLEEVIFSDEEVGVFLVRDGREICVIPAPGVDERRIRLNLVGVVMAFLLYQRGFLVLHASGVVIAGGVVGFLGESGWGKSSMAAALNKLGYSIFTDDVLPADLSSSIPAVFSGFPQIKLHPQAAFVLGFERELLFELHPSQEKLGFRIESGFANASLPLRSIYLLGVGKEQQIERLPLQEAVIELVRHSYPTRAKQCGGIVHLSKCVQIAKQVPVYCLRRPHSLSLLPTLAQLVEEHDSNNN